MTTGALQNAVSGLNIAQQQIALTARNSTNATTEGYTKKRLPQQALYAGDVFVGVRVGELTRSVDTDLQRDVFAKTGNVSYFTTSEDYLVRLQQTFGRPESGNTIAGSLSKLDSQFTKLSANPNDSILQQAIVRDAQSVAQEFNDLSNQISSERNNIERELTTVVADLNNSLEEIASLNVTIVDTQAAGRSSADLEDKRDLALQKVAGILDITYFERSDGALIIQNNRGALLADTRARPVTFTPSNISAQSYYPLNVNGVLIDGTTDLAATTTGGQLGSLLNLRDTVFPQAQAQLDELAHKTALRFQGEGLRLFVDATTGLVPPDAPPAYVGFSTSMEVPATIIAAPVTVQQGWPVVVAADPANSTLAIRVSQNVFGLNDNTGVPHAPFRTTGLGPDGLVATGLAAVTTLDLYAADFILFQSQQNADAEQNLETETNFRDALGGRLLDESGVNLDVELSKLQELQQIYTASAKLIQTINELFQELSNAI